MKFEKVSLEQYCKDFQGDFISEGINKICYINQVFSGLITVGFDTLKDSDGIEQVYNDIKLPERATKKSAGYDFFAPYDFYLNPGQTIKMATGIRVLLDDDKFLMCVPRSGHGFKARIQLDNTVGIIDADYSESSNEGHIHIKLTNDSNSGNSIHVKKGEGMMQAIILPYFTVEDDKASRQRDGGFGSTSNKED